MSLQHVEAVSLCSLHVCCRGQAKSITGDLIKLKGALKVCPQGGLVTFFDNV